MNTEEQKNLFKVWLQKTRNVGSSTLRSYTDGVLGKLLEIIEYSKNPSLKSINPNMYFYQTIEDFDKFVLLLKNDPNFDIVNKTGQPQGGWVATPLNHYRKFLLSNKTESQNINESIEFLREKLINFYKAKGLEIKETGAYTTLKYNKNVAEVHKATKQTNRFRIVINYDLLNDEFKNEVRKVPDSYNWTNLNGEFWIDSEKTLNSAIEKINNILSKINKQEAVYTAEIKQGDSMKNIPLNQILYGPPGTGKTYNTVLKAMSIIDNTEYKDVSEKKYSKLKTRFDKLKETGQIEFVTFHQSYSYEEFVEGIKPNLDNENLGYKIEDGIFKQICQKRSQIQINKNTNFFEISMNFEQNDNDLFVYCLENNVLPFESNDSKNNLNIRNLFQKIANTEIELFAKGIAEYKNKTITRTDLRNMRIVNGNKFAKFFEKHLNKIKEELETEYNCKLIDLDDVRGNCKAYKVIPLKISEKFKNSIQNNDIIFIIDEHKLIRAIGKVIENDEQIVTQEYTFKKVKWLYKGEGIPTYEIYDKNANQYGIKLSALHAIIKQNLCAEEKQPPHILIIDEINRGNISKIFGELITLIEEDKRENLSVKLPYSQETFTVPKNLFIIGTMNTSDRSIASIDIALRRRFKFKEMMPQKELVADFGIGFTDIFESLNTKIKILLDRDHQIGHSYFIKTKYENAGIDELKEIWFSEILPLLNEYFYCDWEKLKLIIPGFIKKLDVPEALKNECDDSVYEFKTFDEVSDFEKALNQEKFE